MNFLALCRKIIQFEFIATCAKVKVTHVSTGKPGLYFYFTNQVQDMKKLFGFNSINKKKIDVVREGPSGYWVGKIKIWWDEDGEYYYGYKAFNYANGDWLPGDTIKSKKCAENGNYSNISN